MRPSRPQSYQIGPYVVRRDATGDTWRIFRDGRFVRWEWSRFMALKWARENA